MKKADLIRLLKEGNVVNVTNADQTVQNIETKVVKNGTEVADGKEGHAASLNSELPTQKEIEKEVNKDEGPMIAVDKDGVSKNGGDCDKLMSDNGVEAERKKEDNGMKDVLNVSTRKVEEASEVSNELLAELQEAAKREESYKEKINKITALCEKALLAQEDSLTREHANKMNAVFQKVITEGAKLEEQLKEAAAKNEKLHAKAQKLYENSNKLNKILLEAVKKAQPEKEMNRFMTPAMRAARINK